MMETDLNYPKASMRSNLVQEHTTIYRETHNIGVAGGYKDTKGLEMRWIATLLFYLCWGVSTFGVEEPQHNNKPPFRLAFLS